MKSCIYIFHLFSLSRKDKDCSRFQYICSPFLFVQFFSPIFTHFSWHFLCIQNAFASLLPFHVILFFFIYFSSVDSLSPIVHFSQWFTASTLTLSLCLLCRSSLSFSFLCSGITASHSLFTLFFISIFILSSHFSLSYAISHLYSSEFSPHQYAVHSAHLLLPPLSFLEAIDPCHIRFAPRSLRKWTLPH